jgi:hypothetical protein
MTMMLPRRLAEAFGQASLAGNLADDANFRFWRARARPDSHHRDNFKVPQIAFSACHDLRFLSHTFNTLCFHLTIALPASPFGRGLLHARKPQVMRMPDQSHSTHATWPVLTSSPQTESGRGLTPLPTSRNSIPGVRMKHRHHHRPGRLPKMEITRSNHLPRDRC